MIFLPPAIGFCYYVPALKGVAVIDWNWEPPTPLEAESDFPVHSPGNKIS